MPVQLSNPVQIDLRRRRHFAGRSRLIGLLLGVALGSSVMAGCGDDSSDGGAATPSRTAAATLTVTSVATSTAMAVPTETSTPPNTATATRTGTPPSSPTGTPSATLPPTATPTVSPTAAVLNPTVEGPIEGPGSPFVQSTSFDLSAVGYSQQEYFISGTARAYTNVGALDSDGVWGVTAGTTAAYTTRILVYRPIDAQKFNGSVVIEWLNVSGGLDAAPDWTSMHTELIRAGYVWIGVSAQQVGIGPRVGPGPIPGLPDLSLKGINPQRYGALVHPGDSFSYDIFSQVSQAVRSPVGVDPLAGLTLQRLIAVGESQSAFRMVTYVNAIHPLVHLHDGFLIHSRGGSGAPLSQAPQAAVALPDVVRIRDDLTVPVLTFETETDLMILGFLPDRQPDGPLLRLWEVAGTAHADTYTLSVGFSDQGNSAAVANIVVTAAPIPGIIVCDRPINSGPQHWVLKAAIAALDRWIRDGEAPPSAPRLEVTGSPAEYVLDAHGNVLGGIRTPYVDAPIAALSGLGQTGSSFCRIFGTTVPFDAATLASLYPDHDAYVSAVNAATDGAVAAGFTLQPDGELIKSAAAASTIGN